MRQLKKENAKLKQMVADLSLDKQMLQDVIKKNFEAVAKEVQANLFFEPGLVLCQKKIPGIARNFRI